MKLARSILRWPLALALVAAPAAGHAAEPVVFSAGPDWDIVLGGQIRPRFLAHSGKDFRGSASEWREFVSQRARLGLGAEAASGFTLRVEIQDVRIWGEEDDTLSDSSADGLDVHQAFASIPILEALAFKIGRQEIDLDRQRLVSTVDWTQRARAFDAARLGFTALGGAIAIDALYAKVEETGQDPDGHVPAGRSGDVDFAGLHTSFEFLPEQEIAPLYLVRSNAAIDELRHTLGLTAMGRARGLSYGVELFYQLGTTVGARIDAYLLAANLRYTFDVEVLPEVGVWAELLSGGSGALEGAFDTLYGNNHDLYGEMDFFIDIPRDTAARGLVDLGGRVGSGIWTDLRMRADFHHFRTEDDTPRGERTLGDELDAVLSWQAHDYVTLEGLYGIFWPGAAMRDVSLARSPTVLLPRSLSTEHQVYVTVDAKF